MDAPPYVGAPGEPVASEITALLGPTNTGKTHRAIERMLQHRSGMIGLPLRLLAREVYDRITARLGERRVALVTGEEKRVPPAPDYWVCTVESMPLDREVDFLCVDEIQLAAHRQRGHMFTDRLLRARGRRESWFLGAQTMREMVEELVPTAHIEGHPRFSKLSWAGEQTLGSLPPRSAVVAFSVPDVYEIAERLRRRHGGTAVVLGALSPRTRNAQVAMYEAGEVHYMVATDAIGMGLNLDLDNVVFASLQKFDGKQTRPLEPAEIAQIAGRAGRYTRDGTFGVLKPVRPPHPQTIEAIERNDFPPERRLVWRNSDLDFSSVSDLIASLRRRPHRGVLRLIEQAEDFEALLQLAGTELVQRRATRPEVIELLWDVCRVPDFRKLLFDSHVQLLARLFEQLSDPSGRIDPAWMARRIARLDDVEGDIETLMNRIAFIRTWTYIANHEGWVRDAAHWQDVTRAIEDRQSDALHRRLTERFVEQVADGHVPARGRRRNPPRRAVVARKVDPDHPFGKLATLELPALTVDEPDETGWVDEVVDAPHHAFVVDEHGDVVVGSRRVARLRRGNTLLHPDVVLTTDELRAGAQARLHRRLRAWAKDALTELLEPVEQLDGRACSAAARGLLYQLQQGLGTVDRRAARDQLAALRPEDRQALAAAGVSVGRTAVYVPSSLGARSIRLRAALWSTFFCPEAPVPAPPKDAVSLPLSDEVDPSFYPHVGYVVRGRRAYRVDVLERVIGKLQELGAASQGQGFEDPPWVCPELGIKRGVLAGLLRSLGYRKAKGRWRKSGRGSGRGGRRRRR